MNPGSKIRSGVVIGIIFACGDCECSPQADEAKVTPTISVVFPASCLPASFQAAWKSQPWWEPGEGEKLEESTRKYAVIHASFAEKHRGFPSVIECYPAPDQATTAIAFLWPMSSGNVVEFLASGKQVQAPKEKSALVLTSDGSPCSGAKTRFYFGERRAPEYRNADSQGLVDMSGAHLEDFDWIGFEFPDGGLLMLSGNFTTEEGLLVVQPLTTPGKERAHKIWSVKRDASLLFWKFGLPLILTGFALVGLTFWWVRKQAKQRDDGENERASAK